MSEQRLELSSSGTMSILPSQLHTQQRETPNGSNVPLVGQIHGGAAATGLGIYGRAGSDKVRHVRNVHTNLLCQAFRKAKSKRAV